MTGYRTPVADAVSAATGFAEELNQQLDPAKGGFAWWRDQLDSKRLILIGDYLIQSVNGVAESLLDASLSCEDHGAALTADNFWIVRQANSVERENSRATNDDHLRAIMRAGREDERDRRLSMTADSCLFYLVQCLDRCAAMVAIVGALELDVLKVGWGQIEGLGPDGLAPTKKKRRPLNSLPSDAGLITQADLVRQLSAWMEFGPAGWLPWLVQTRNAHAHRAQSTSWHLLMVSRGRGMGLCRPFFRQPELSEMHSMTKLTPGRRDMSSHLLLEESITVLRGLLESTTGLAARLIQAAREVWDTRRRNPTLLVQPGKQWPLSREHAARSFDGYGVPAQLQKNPRLHVHPTLARRLLAAKVMDADSNFWQEGLD